MNDQFKATDPQSQFMQSGAERDFLQSTKLENRIGLCLSGGGYRAMLYHVGVVIRLNSAGILPRLAEVASVSGGSITAAFLALNWEKLDFNADGVASNILTIFAEPIVKFAKLGVDLKAILYGLIPGGSADDYLVKAYNKHLFQGAGLQAVVDYPRFTFMATNLQTGSGWRFSKNYAADFRVGLIGTPVISLARVVAASSAFPPFLSPVRIDLSGMKVNSAIGTGLHRKPFTDIAVLTDGGVYDNLGLERVWKRCRTIFVSNAGLPFSEIGNPTGWWFGQARRALSISQEQSENSRRRILFGMANLGQREVAYWDIATAPAEYGIPDPLSLSKAESTAASRLRTRLNPFSAKECDLLLKAGYAGADASLRARGFIDSPGKFSDLPLELSN